MERNVYTTVRLLKWPYRSNRKLSLFSLRDFKCRLVRLPLTVTKSIFGIMIKWPFSAFFLT